MCTKDTYEKSTTEEKKELLKKKICVTGYFDVCYQQSLVFEPYVILASTVVPPGTVK